MRIFPEVPQSFAEIGQKALRRFIRDSEQAAVKMKESFASLITEGADKDELLAEMRAGVEALELARTERDKRASVADAAGEFADLADRATAAAEDVEEAAEGDEDEEEAEEGDEADGDEPETAEAEDVETAEVEDVEEETAEVVTAAAVPARRAPARSRKADPRKAPGQRLPVTLTASAEGLGYGLGAELPGGNAVAEMMTRRRGMFGDIPDGTRGDKIPIARMTWADGYPEERTLTDDMARNLGKIEKLVDPEVIQLEMSKRRAGTALVASGGLCAPVTPYYQLQYISTADRPVRAALPSFAADRGGIRYATPPGLSAITTGVGVKTEAQDRAGGSDAVKSCQVVDCPDFNETDVAIIYHCLQFGNLGARTFPERVTHFNNLVLAAHARLAEGRLLDGIAAGSTDVSASALGLGASATIPSQLLAAASEIRSANRMNNEAVLRALLPFWVLDLLVSDVYRSQFGRFDMTRAGFIALLRAGNIEPSFYMDEATGSGQVFDTQADGPLEAFPANVVSFLFPEGSFLYLDGGVLELGLVRDSILNSTNDYQIFGESFENVAFIGVQSLMITTPVCDSGAVSAPATAPTCPIDYTVTT